MSCDVSLVRCTDYEIDHIRAALDRLLAPLGGLDWVTPGMKIVIKANLVAGRPPEDAVTTHPALLCALSEMLIARGASVVIGDRPWRGIQCCLSRPHLPAVRRGRSRAIRRTPQSEF